MPVRDADPSRDAPACAGIYAPFVRDSAVSFEEVPPGPAEMASRMEGLQQSYPWLVADEGGAIAGYAYAARHRARPAYRWSVDVTVYVAEGWRGRGVGRALYGVLLPKLAEQGFRVACAGITLPNEASVALHERFGFEFVGVHRGIGWKEGAWRDVGWWQVDLAPALEGVPAEPGSPRRGPIPR